MVNSVVLHQLLAASSKGKGKGKARAQSSDFLLAPINYENKQNWNETIEAFCSLVEKYKTHTSVDEEGS
jgi:hypothetical protein